MYLHRPSAQLLSINNSSAQNNTALLNIIHISSLKRTQTTKAQQQILFIVLTLISQLPLTDERSVYRCL